MVLRVLPVRPPVPSFHPAPSTAASPPRSFPPRKLAPLASYLPLRFSSILRRRASQPRVGAGTGLTSYIPRRSKTIPGNVTASTLLRLSTSSPGDFILFKPFSLLPRVESSRVALHISPLYLPLPRRACIQGLLARLYTPRHDHRHPSLPES